MKNGGMMNNTEIIAILTVLGIGVGVLVGLIALAIYLIKKSNEEAHSFELAYAQILQGLPQEKQMIFMMQFNGVKKTSTTAVLLSLFLGGLGVHKFYMGQTGLGMLYLVFCWTYIPAIIGFIEALTIAGQVGKYNQQKAIEIASFLR
jgi:TM2 domain-containing membrane protein YozV